MTEIKTAPIDWKHIKDLLAVCYIGSARGMSYDPMPKAALADALEEAGCQDSWTLARLREGKFTPAQESAVERWIGLRGGYGLNWMPN